MPEVATLLSNSVLFSSQLLLDRADKAPLGVWSGSCCTEYP